ncbi:histidine phosphatase family protein [Rhodoplanes sp. TEM]|uniref:Histidine phosphatase family protein n=1 Tax=Rhodoplanes tepidamans TaxID=200616 RepID=A0ABT5J888_RHOTP|nr:MULTISPECIES: histidine phosphatase family protein [Rhodoplanes]MDC7785875.1 histidine phosphatase family protein [Rhodoplanes tepidamans]MDC7984987.1 histidine phosphatase family protein [Rhodoplanes sp. TEM]MDQ0355507.1 broad specificity phosphatase PhoE [Rhodoplanes tepidamans]
MTARLILLCHAATPATRAARFPADELVEAGAAASLHALAARLPQLDAAVCGRERRCGETAAGLGLDARPVAALDDWMLGGWRGRDPGEIVAGEPEGFAAWRSDPDAAPHGGESLAMLLDRVRAWLDAGPPQRRCLAVTHPAVMRAAIVHVLGAPALSFWRVDAGPLASADLRHDGRRWVLRPGGLDGL